MKCCTKCKVEQNLNNFSKNGDGYRSICKTCRNLAAKEYRIANIDIVRAKDKTYYECNRTQRLEANRKYRKEHRDAICEQKQNYYEENKEKILEYHSERKTLRNLQKCERRAQNPHIRIVEALKSRVHRVLKDKLTTRSWKYIGCCKLQLTNWIEFQFDENMSWDNYGSYWHIDHVIPINMFNIQDKQHINICFHWSNLRPLEKKQNMSKSNKIVFADIFAHNKTLNSYITTFGYQTIPEKAWWLRTELRYGKNPEDDFVNWLTNEMGNPQPSS